MKKYFKKFIYKPKTVTITSLIIAFIIGVYAYNIINTSPKHEFVIAKSGSILNQNTNNGDTQHVSLGFLSSGKVQTLSVQVGDMVKKGQILAALDSESTLGSVTQAQAAYTVAKANYEKVLNGATDSTINVANSSVITAEQNLDNLIQNGYTQIDSLIQTNIDSLYLYPNSDNAEFKLSFFDSSTNNTVSIQPNDSNIRLNLRFARINIVKLLNDWKNMSYNDRDISAQKTIQNLQAVKLYLLDLSSALNTFPYDSRYQTNIDKAKSNVSNARISVDNMITNIQNSQLAIKNAKTSVTAITAPARSEDIQSAQAQMTSTLGALQIAESNYNNRIIISPGEGTVTAIKTSVGEIISANTTAIELIGKDFSREVSITLPKSTIIQKDGRTYVLVKDLNTENTIQKEVVLGISDNQNIEVLSGISINDEIAIIN